MQVSSAPHALSQAPQCASSFLRLKHEGLSPTTHFVVPPLQSSSHAPTEHSWSAVHAVPHAPQFAPSTCVSTQRFLPSTSHLVVPPAHLSAQAPREHTSSAPHALPHAPQLDGSKRTSRHAPSHSFLLAVQLGALLPPEPPAPPSLTGVSHAASQTAPRADNAPMTATRVARVKRLREDMVLSMGHCGGRKVKCDAARVDGAASVPFLRRFFWGASCSQAEGLRASSPEARQRRARSSEIRCAAPPLSP